MLFSLALRNALRNRRRSALTALTVMFGVALLTIAMAWVQGVMSAMLDSAARVNGAVRVVDPEFARREQLLSLAENIPVSAPLEEAIRGLDLVTAVYPRIQTGVTISAGDEIGERFGLVTGAPLGYYTEQVHLDEQIAEGRMLAEDGEVVLGKVVAEQVGVRPGGDVILLGMTQDGSISPVKLTVAGIADLGNNMQNRQIFVTLEKARWMADIPDGTTELLAFTEDRNDARELAAAIAALPAAQGLDVTAWDQRKPFSDMLPMATTIQSIAASVIVFITALGVLNTMLMSVLERTSEIGVLRALGIKRREVMSLFVLEAMGISLVGGLLGAVIGGLGGYYLQVVGVNLGSAVDKMPIAFNSTIYARLTPAILVGAVLLGLVMAIIGSVLPAWRASHVQPVEAMRSRH